MKKRPLSFLILVLALLLIPYSYSHFEESYDYQLDASSIYPISTWEVVGYGSLAFGLLIVIILTFSKKMNETVKKMTFFLIVAIVGLITLYLVLTTLHLNIISESKGPVHWHADFEIWACDKELKLPKPKGLSNKQGVDLLHAHDDNRIHVEGVLLTKRGASLGAFFHAVGGSLAEDGMKVPTDDGLITVHEGDLCNGQPARLYAFVNGQRIYDYNSYIISPHDRVPPGDRIKIIFTEKLVEEIDPNIRYVMEEKKEENNEEEN